MILFAVLAELLIFLVTYYISASLGETFKYSARYSGRLSLIIFLMTFYAYSTSEKSISENVALKNLLRIFAIVHVIHFGFLATNIYLNDIPLEISRLMGGLLAYLMIVIAPFKLDKISPKLQWVYFYYVCFVMIMTYVARINGGFEGAEPFWFHYLAFSVLVLCSIIFGWLIYKKKPFQ